MAADYTERIHVYNGERSSDSSSEELGIAYASCSEPEAVTAHVVYHPNALQCSGESNWICLDCGERTGEAAEA